MKSFYASVSVVCLFLSAAGLGQQGMTRPVISAPPPAAAAPAAAPAANQPVTVPQDYVLGTEDTIQVTVWKEPTVSGPLVVRPDGMISLPLVGELAAAGKKPLALSDEIATRLKRFINDPLVTVTVTGVNSKRIFFIGEVARPGPIALTPSMTMLQAVSSAGGLTPYANAKHMYILRGEQGKQQKIPFDYKKAVQQGNQQGVTLTAGDTVVVP